MKTIEVSEEMHAKLMELAKEMTTQNMRHTRMPHMFQVSTQKRVYNIHGEGEFSIVVVDSEDYPVNKQEEAIELIKTHCHESNEDLPGDFEEFELFELIDWLVEHGFEYYSYDLEPEYKNTFFTAKACEEHIKSNEYHYTDPTCFLNSAWRNPEMELVSEFLCNLVGKSNHK